MRSNDVCLAALSLSSTNCSAQMMRLETLQKLLFFPRIRINFFMTFD